MSNKALKLKKTLNSIIADMEKNPHSFVKNPKTDFSRKRKFSFSTMMKILITMGGQTLNKELIEYFDYDISMAKSSAFVQQRSKILSSALEHLFNEFNEKTKSKNLHKGYRLLAADGSVFAYQANQEDENCYFYNGKKPYNLIHLNALYDLVGKTYICASVCPERKSNECAALNEMVDKFEYKGKAIFIADRGYESYNTFAHIENAGYNYAIRVKDIHSNGIIKPLNLPDEEFDIDYEILLSRKMAKLPGYRYIASSTVFDFLPPGSDEVYKMKLRIVRFKISDDKYEVLITNLPGKTFSSGELKRLYAMRWGIETSFRELKYTIGLLAFHSKKAEFIEQEIFARLVMYNFCSSIASDVKIEKENTKYAYKVDFTMAVYICKRVLLRKKGEKELKVEELIKMYVTPIRNDRHNKRKLKPRSYISFNNRIA